MITAHQGDSAAYTWRLQNFTLGEHVLKPPKSKKRKADSQPEADEPAGAAVTAVGMSQCGNYGLVGRASGSVDRYNMQSGLHRGSYTRCAATLSSALVLGHVLELITKREGRQPWPFVLTFTLFGKCGEYEASYVFYLLAC